MRRHWRYLLCVLVLIATVGCSVANSEETQDGSVKVLYAQRYEEDHRSELNTLDLSTSSIQRLTEQEQLFGVNGQASVSPDGTKVAFVSNRDGERQIYTMAPDGSDVRRLTYSDVNEGYPVWSPDGSSIAFVRFAESDWGYGEIWTMAANGSDPRHLPDTIYSGYPAWSPDGTMIASILGGLNDGNNWGGFLRVMDIYGSDQPDFNIKVKVAATNPLRGTPLAGHIPFAPAPALSWSPDSSKIVMSCLPETESLLPEKLEICVADVRSGDIAFVTHNTAPEYYPMYSPDGNKIAFVSTQNGIDLYLYVMDSDGTAPKALAPDDYAMAAPVWSPDGDMIAIIANYQVCIVALDSGDISRFGESVWPPDPLSWVKQDTP